MNEAYQIISELQELRIQLAEYTVRFAETERALALAKATVEANAIKMVGSEKELGSNQASRDRALLLLATNDEVEGSSELREAQNFRDDIYLEKAIIFSKVKRNEEVLKFVLGEKSND